MQYNIRDAQERLVELGLYGTIPDGVDGPKTRDAVRAFQRIHGLKVDGIVGPKTAAEMWPKDAPERKAPHVGEIVANGRWPRQVDVPDFFGKVGDNQAPLELPFPMWLAWDKRVKVHKITLHRLVHDSAARAFASIAATYSAPERNALGIDLFGGSLNVRKMRGGSNWSMHSWGIAIDFDPARNGLNSKREPGANHARLSDPDAGPFWQAWEKEGWLSLGRARNFDWMHVQAARL